MSEISRMRPGDFEHQETRANPLYPSGRALMVRVSKAGGGSTDRAYDGRWLYRVTFVGDNSNVLLEGDDLETGTPKTHRQVVEILMDFLPEELGTRQ